MTHLSTDDAIEVADVTSERLEELLKVKMGDCIYSLCYEDILSVLVDHFDEELLTLSDDDLWNLVHSAKKACESIEWYETIRWGIIHGLDYINKSKEQ